MSKTIKLVLSPFTPAIDHALGLNFQVFVPYGDDHVTLQVNPNITDYQEDASQENVQVRQLTVTQGESKTVQFNFTDKNTQVIEYEGKKIDIKLMSIGTENIEGQDFYSFEFFVSERE